LLFLSKPSNVSTCQLKRRPSPSTKFLLINFNFKSGIAERGSNDAGILVKTSVVIKNLLSFTKELESFSLQCGYQVPFGGYSIDQALLQSMHSSFYSLKSLKIESSMSFPSKPPRENHCLASFTSLQEFSSTYDTFNSIDNFLKRFRNRSNGECQIYPSALKDLYLTFNVTESD